MKYFQTEVKNIETFSVEERKIKELEEIKKMVEVSEGAIVKQNQIINKIISNYDRLYENHTNLEIAHESAKLELMMKNDLILRRAEINQKNYGETIRKNSQKSRMILKSEIRKQRRSSPVGLISLQKSPISLQNQNVHAKSPGDFATTKQLLKIKDE